MSPSLSEDDENRKREELKANWKIPAIAQYVSLYRGAFKLPEIEIEDLEEGLLDDDSVERKILIELLVALIRGINPKTNKHNWDIHLQKIVQKQFASEGKRDPYTGEDFKKKFQLSLNTPEDDTDVLKFLEDSVDSSGIFLEQQEPRKDSDNISPFWHFDTSTQADIIHTICLMRLDRSDAIEALKKMDADALRVLPLGSDDLGNEYWYFYGTRLYKQEPAVSKNKNNWEEEWRQQKEQSFKKRGRGRPRKTVQKQRKSDGESDDFEDVDSGKNKRFMNVDEKSRWSVVCNTIEDWIEFAEKFKNSKSECERALFETVKDNFLPALSEIYKQKERRLQQKLKELIRSKTVDEQTTRIITRRETRRQNTDLNDSFNSNESDSGNAHREHMNKSRADRLEERNRRASEGVGLCSQRSKRQKYSSDEELDEMDDKESNHSFDSDKYLKDYDPSYSDEGMDMRMQLLKLISEVRSHKDAGPFLSPVDKDVPGYYEIVSQPIDLSVISQKLFDSKYHTINDLVADFHKLVENCRLYNGVNNPRTRMANTIFQLFLKGLNKIDYSHTTRNETVLHKETSSITVTSQYSQTKAISKRRTNSFKSKKKTKKIRHAEAIEALSRETELAVEKSNSSSYLESMQATNNAKKQISSFSDLKIVPIHNHPTELMEKFMSNSPHQEDEEVCDKSPLVSHQAGDSLQNFDMSSNTDSLQSPTGSSCFMSHNEEENSDLSVFIDKNQSEVEEDSTSSMDATHQHKSGNSPHGSHQSNKGSTSSSEGLMHGVANILDDCHNQNVSNMLSGFNREPIYSTNEANTSSGNISNNSPHYQKSGNSSPEQVRESPQSSTPNFTKNPVVEKHIPFLHEGLNVQSEFGNFPAGNEQSTVDASVLGFSSFASIPPRVSPISLHPPGSAITASSPTQVSSTVATFTTHMTPSSAPREMTSVQFTPPLQVNAPYEKMFPYQNPVQIYKPEPNKFPTMKVSLPPSTGEILVVPDKSDPTKMTFHLLAQPHLNPSQPIQSCIELRANNSSGNPANQHNQTSEMRTDKEHLLSASPKQKSPLMDVPQFPIVSSGMSLVPPQSLEKNISGTNFSSLLKVPSTFPNFSSNNSLFTTTYANSFMPVSANLTDSASSMKSDYQLIKPSNFTTQSAVYNKSTRPSNGICSNSDNGNLFLQTPRTLNSSFIPTTLPSYRMDNNTKAIGTKTNSTYSKQTSINVQKVYVPSNNSSSVIPSGNREYQVISLPKENIKKIDGNQHISKAQSLDKQYNLNAAKSFSETTTPGPYYSAYNNALQNYAFTSTLNPPLVYTQVNPSQPSQFVNIPNYMIANQNMFQYPLNHPVMNVQPFPASNRPVISMDLINR